MKIFVSSLIAGMELFRGAARTAVSDLGHEAIMAEDLAARPQSPQVACLDGLRQSGLVILLLGSDYGAKQPSGISATHEEYREAKANRPVIAFVQAGVDRDADQSAFVHEVQQWEGGLFRGTFRTPEDLRRNIVRAIHEWQIANAAGPVDPDVLLEKALSLLPQDGRQIRGYGVSLALSIAAGPGQPILRPSELEASELADGVLQAALFGSTQIFSAARGSSHLVERHTLVVHQGEGGPSVRLDAEGNMVFAIPLEGAKVGPIVIEEEVATKTFNALRFGAWLLDRIDPTQRVTHVAPAVTLIGSESVIWRTRAQQAASPNSYSLGWGQEDHEPIHLLPPHRPRSALVHDDRLAEDLVTLLRRRWKARDR